MIGKETLDLLEQSLAPHGHITVERRSASLVLTPQLPPGYPETFAVSVYDEGHECMVAALRWHTHFDESQEACEFVSWLFTPYMRLVEEYKGGLFVASWVESYQLDGWQAELPVFFLNPHHEADWVAGPEEKYLRVVFQQAVLAPPGPYDEFVPGANLDPETGLPMGSELGKTTLDADGPFWHCWDEPL